MIEVWKYDKGLIIQFNTVPVKCWHMVYNYNNNVRFIFQTDGITYTNEKLFCSKNYQEIIDTINRLQLKCDLEKIKLYTIEISKGYFHLNGMMKVDVGAINTKEKFINLLKKGASITI